MNFKNWVKSIQTAGYNGARKAYVNPVMYQTLFEQTNIFPEM